MKKVLWPGLLKRASMSLSITRVANFLKCVRVKFV